jgi:hypothetical protein
MRGYPIRKRWYDDTAEWRAEINVVGPDDDLLNRIASGTSPAAMLTGTNFYRDQRRPHGGIYRATPSQFQLPSAIGTNAVRPQRRIVAQDSNGLIEILFRQSQK